MNVVRFIFDSTGKLGQMSFNPPVMTIYFLPVFGGNRAGLFVSVGIEHGARSDITCYI